MKSFSSIEYRPDIDGLRALAILLVVGFHAFPMWIKGGFIGVDIFFVISGYLISSILLKDIQQDKKFFSNFYIRRIKRILPSLIVVLASTLFLGWLLLVKEDFILLAKHTASGSIFISNFLLLSESGYFDAAANTKPLLHLWSLSVEEQFYLFCPILFRIFYRYRYGLILLILSVFALSFCLNIYTVSSAPFFSFYSPIARIWELLTGAILAYYIIFKNKIKLFDFIQSIFDSKINKNLISLFGISLILIGLFKINKESNFPGWLAIYPTLGTAMIIFSGHSVFINKYLLSNKIAVSIGKISYPLYLWHWPLLSLTYLLYASGADPSRNIRILVVIISFILAILTYICIEKPIRLKIFSSKKIVAILVIILATVGSYSGGIYYNIIRGSFGSNNVKVINKGELGSQEFTKYHDANYYSCLSKNLFKLKEKVLFNSDKYTECSQSKKVGIPKIVIIGDSHGHHLLPGLSRQLKDFNVMYIKVWPLPNVSNGKILEPYFNWIVDQSDIKTIIISNYWPLTQEYRYNIWHRLNSIVKVFSDAGKTIFISNDIPTFHFNPKYCKYSGWINLGICTESYSTIMNRHQIPLNEIRKIISLNKNTFTLDTMKYFCSTKYCSMAKNGYLFYRDEHHLNLNGSFYLGGKIIKDIFPNKLTTEEIINLNSRP